MNYIKIVLIVVVCISSTLRVFGQHIKDTIFHSQTEIVKKIHIDEKYIGIKVDSKESPKGKGILFNKKGERILEYEQDTDYMLDFIPNERYNQIIIINSKYVYPVAYKDELVAFDIDTKSIKWKARLTASQYLISPDGKYLMTEISVSSADERKNEFGIINLLDGSMLPVNFDLGEDYFATWLDSQRVILYSTEWEMERNDRYFKELDKYQKEIKKIYKEKADLYFEYKADSSISEQDFKIEYQKYINQLDSLSKDHTLKTEIQPVKVGEVTQDRFIGRPLNFSTISMNFVLYNIVTNEIESKKIYNRGNNIISTLRYQRMGSISVDQEKNIYVVDSKDRLHQLDNNFNVNWSVKMKQPYAVYKVLTSDSIFFIAAERTKNEYSIISKKGEKKLLTDTDDLIANKKIQRRSRIVDLKSGVEFDVENNLIKLRRK